MASNLIDANFNTNALISRIHDKLAESLRVYEQEMKMGALQGTEPASPGWWRGNVASYIQLEDLGGGGGMIVFGLGLIDGTPEQALWQAYIFNSGSGPVFSVFGSYYNVNTGATEKGGAPPLYEHRNWGKGANRWFDDVADKLTSSALMDMMERIVRETVQELFANGAWRLKGHFVTIRI